LTDNGKVFTGRFGPADSSAEVLFARVCAENGIRYLLTAPRSPTTTGKVERWYKTIRAEFLRDHDYKHATMAELQQALDAWVDHYNTERPHQALGMQPPIERFQLAAPPGVETVVEPSAVPAAPPVAVVEPSPTDRAVARGAALGGPARPDLPRWVPYQVPIVLAGEPVEAVAADHLVRIFHREVLVAEHVQRRPRPLAPTATTARSAARSRSSCWSLAFASVLVRALTLTLRSTEYQRASWHGAHSSRHRSGWRHR
jgi:Integrase core domain